MRILTLLLLSFSFAACTPPEEDPNGTSDVTSDTAIPSENDASVDTDSVDQNNAGTTLLSVGSPCALNCDGCCVEGSFCSTDGEPGMGCMVTQGTCRIPNDEGDMGYGPYWRVCGCDGIRAIGPNGYFQAGGSGPLISCMGEGPDCIIVEGEDNCDEGSGCIAMGYDSVNYVGECVSIELVCTTNDGPMENRRQFCTPEDQTRCWPNLCDALRDGYRGPV